MGTPHAVCLPYPAQGHITPMLNVAKLLHARGFDVTFVNTEYNHARLVRTRGAASVAGIPGFRFATIPDGLPPFDDDVTQDIPSLCRSTTKTCLGLFRRLLANLNDPATGRPPVTCVVSDVVMGFSIDAAKELGLPYVQLWTASATRFLCYRLLMSRGHAPLKDVKQLTSGSLDTPVEEEVLRNIRIPNFIHAAMDPDDYMGEVVAAIDALGMVPKVYTVGPLPLVEREDPPTPRSSISLSLWKEREGARVRRTNCWYQCNEWGVGVEIHSNVRRDAVASLVTELMDGEQGKEMRRKAREWRDKALQAGAPDRRPTAISMSCSATCFCPKTR
ncbi:hypothetical protein EJB05_37771, partial [Eragrostis curvula]